MLLHSPKGEYKHDMFVISSAIFACIAVFCFSRDTKSMTIAAAPTQYYP